jgi:hypothetical protein
MKEESVGMSTVKRKPLARKSKLPKAIKAIKKTVKKAPKAGIASELKQRVRAAKAKKVMAAMPKKSPMPGKLPKPGKPGVISLDPRESKPGGFGKPGMTKPKPMPGLKPRPGKPGMVTSPGFPSKPKPIVKGTGNTGMRQAPPGKLIQQVMPRKTKPVMGKKF